MSELPSANTLANSLATLHRVSLAPHALKAVRFELHSSISRDSHVPLPLNYPEGFQGCVLDGRDVGTVLCPNAEVKLLLTASAEVRARRRLAELISRGMVQAEAQTSTYRG